MAAHFLIHRHDPQRIGTWRKSSEEWILSTGTGKVTTEADFARKAAISRERQVAVNPQQFPCLFRHKNKVLPGKSPSNSSDLAPANFFYSLQWKLPSNNDYFRTPWTSRRNVTAELNAVPLHAFDGCFVQLLQRHKKCAAVKGQYFEG
jgi:hypothetical protein